MSGDALTAAYQEIDRLFDKIEADRDPWDQYWDGYTSGLAKALAILETHMRENE